MRRVITYGTFDLLHYGHIRLLERAKSLGDYLIVGVTSDDFDKSRGKINVTQTLMERMEAVRATGIADEIIVEEYEGQKIDDIRRYNVDIFTVGSDWVGTFDYLNEYCQVVYLDRTEGVSSTALRTKQNKLRMGIVGDSDVLLKYIRESKYVNGLTISAIYTENDSLCTRIDTGIHIVSDFESLLQESDMLYVVSHPKKHYSQVRQALLCGKHVLCESPVAMSGDECRELFALAANKHLILMESIKTAYATAYNRMILLLKSGKIGNVMAVDATCTSLRNIETLKGEKGVWNSLCAWGPTAMLPVFQLLGPNYRKKQITTWLVDEANKFDAFTKMDFQYDHAVATVKVGKGVKSEGDLVVTGTKGYLYVPAPWWKTDYFEIRYENPADNQRCFFQLDGEGIRYELVAFTKSVESKCNRANIETVVSAAIADVVASFEEEDDSVTVLH